MERGANELPIKKIRVRFRGMKILMVEDDLKIAQFVKNGLHEEGYTVDVALDGDEGLKLARLQSYDMMILDLMMPKLDGISVLTSLRKGGAATPILILSAKHTTEDKVFGLESGADDYLAKPFSFSELLARTNALLRRRREPQVQHTIQFQDLVMDRIARQVFYRDQRIDLQSKEFSLLELFLKNPGNVLSKAQILEQIWNVNFDPQTNVVDVLVCRLRSKIEKNIGKKYIYTIRGVGYVLKDEH